MIRPKDIGVGLPACNTVFICEGKYQRYGGILSTFSALRTGRIYLLKPTQPYLPEDQHRLLQLRDNVISQNRRFMLLIC
jgi:hypothetical protein